MKGFPEISIVAALGKDHQIGLDGHLPWSIPEEYAHYQNIVRHQYVLIGRKNFEANQYDVEGAMPLVLSRNPNYQAKNALCFTSLLQVLEWAGESDVKKIYVIGGADIYRLALPYASKFHLSWVDYNGAADTHFPAFHQYEWKTQIDQKHLNWRYLLLTKLAEAIY